MTVNELKNALTLLQGDARVFHLFSNNTMCEEVEQLHVLLAAGEPILLLGCGEDSEAFPVDHAQKIGRVTLAEPDKGGA